MKKRFWTFLSAIIIPAAGIGTAIGYVHKDNNTTPKDIETIKGELQAILDNKNNEAWVVEGEKGLQAEIDTKYGIGQITVTNKVDDQLTSYDAHTNDFTFTGNQTEENKLKYFGTIDLTQTWKTNTTTDLWNIQGDLQKLISKGNLNILSIDDMQAFLNKNDYGVDQGIKVSERNESETKQDKGIEYKYEFVLEGQGNDTNDYKYKNKTSIFQYEFKDNLIDLKDIKNDLEKTINEKYPNESLSPDTLRGLILTKFGENSGITVKDLKKETDLLKTPIDTSESFELLGDAKTEPSHIYYGDISVEHKYSVDDNLININTLTDTLTTILGPTHGHKEWQIDGNDGLQSVVDYLYPNGGITVEITSDNVYDTYQEQVFHFSGDATTKNQHKYYDEIEIKSKYMKDIKDFQYQVSDYLDKNFPTKKANDNDLQTMVDVVFGSNSNIVIDSNISPENANSQKFSLKGADGWDDISTPKYFSEMTPTHEWSQSGKLKPISDIKEKMQAVINQNWNSSFTNYIDLQKYLDANGFWEQEGIKVESSVIENKYSASIDHKTGSRFTFIVKGLAEEGKNNFIYYGETTVFDEVISEQATGYINEYGDQKYTWAKDMSDFWDWDYKFEFANVTLINQIGFFINNSRETVIVTFPVRVETIKGTLPKQVTSLSSVFDGCYNYNQDISGWNTANITNMNYMFYGASNFNKNLSKWTISHVNTHKEYDKGANRWESKNKPNLK